MGATFSVDLVIAVSSYNTNGIDAVVGFDPAKLQVVSVTTGASSPYTTLSANVANATFSNRPANGINNTTGVFEYAARGGGVTNATFTYATVVFKAIGPGTSPIHLLINADLNGVQNFGIGGLSVDGSVTVTGSAAPPPATPPVIFTRTTATAEAWNKYTATFIPTQSGNYTLGFNLTAGGPSGDNSILIDAVKITTGTTTVFSDGFETPALSSNTGVSANGGAGTFGNWACNNYSGILNGSPPNWGLDAQGLGTADGTSQYAYLQAVFGTLGKIKAVNTLALVAGQTYTVTFYQASRHDFGGQVTYNVTIDQVPNDTTPPVITAPVSITQEATGPNGAVVTFTATAVDNVDGPVNVTASPTSGSVFPLGTTQVGLAASDAAHNTATASFPVNVVDTTPPAITAPASITAEATSAAGAIVTYSATASDIVSGNVAVTTSKASGSQFALGNTTVTLTASDARTNTATKNITVTVRDTTKPVVTATMTAKGGGDDESTQSFTLVFSATDAVGVKTLTASLNGITVTNGQVVQLQTIKSGAQTVKRDDGKLQIKATSFAFVVTATDAAGNTSTKTVVPVFVKNGKDDDDHKDDGKKDDGKKGG